MNYLVLGILCVFSFFFRIIDPIESRVYSVDELKNKQALVGQSRHLKAFSFVLHTLPKNESQEFMSGQSELLLIVKEGELGVTLNGKNQQVGPGSIVLVLAGDVLQISTKSKNAGYYLMTYESKNQLKLNDSKEFSSLIIDFDDLEYHEHDRGGIREYYNLSTPNLSYFEMHVTNLNGKIKSHEPHTHGAAEIVLMIKGNTQMQIGDAFYEGSAGDAYFLESEVPHAIENLGDSQCMYFAFQWEA